MKKNLKLTVLISLMVLSMLASACAGNSEAPKSVKKQFVSIATASMGGSYYPIGVGMSELFNGKVPGVEAKVEVTGGATENPKLVGSGESDIGFTNASLAFDAFSGTGLFKDNKYDKLRIMFSGVAPGTFHVAVKADSNINTYADLKGKKVAVGPQGGGALTILPNILELFDMKMEDISPSYMSFDEGVQALTDGHVTAAIVQAPHPAPAIKTLEGTKIPFKFIELSEQQRTELLKKYPYYNKVKISKETYGLSADALTIGSTNVVVINADLDEELVYQMTKTIFENLEAIQKVHPSAKSITLEDAVSDLIPMHKGAERYYKEKGVLK
ncbi:MAG: hypothetical protein JM58_00940 [Peptococcaceae bacterium BICA1-8]|nr:MAG: hypothetical protein JM58_00940 [Peptococcaceae bacterium BICA1-8]